MKKLMKMFEKLAPHLVWFSELKYIKILQDSFIVTMPVLLIGSTFLLIASFPVPAVKEFLAPLNLASVTAVTMDLYSLLLLLGIAYYTTKFNDNRYGTKTNEIITVIIAVSAFILTVKPIWGDMLVGEEALGAPGNYISMYYLGTRGIMAVIVTGIVSTEIFQYLLRKKVTIKMPASVPPMVSQSFASIVPYFAVMTFWWFFAILLGLNIPQIFLDLFKPLVMVGDTLPAVWTQTFLNRALWTVGIHGSNVISGVTGPMLTTMATANLDAYNSGQPLPYVATTYFYDNYVWVGFVPLTILLIRSKSVKLKKLGWLALAPAIFNIGEPIIFGLPIVLNPIMAIPFIFGYLILATVSYILVSIDVLAQPVLSVMWTMPAPIKAFLSTGYQIGPAIYVLLEWLFLFLFFLPFVKIMDKQECEKEAAYEAEQNLQEQIDADIAKEKAEFKQRNLDLKEGVKKE